MKEKHDGRAEGMGGEREVVLVVKVKEEETLRETADNKRTLTDHSNNLFRCHFPVFLGLPHVDFLARLTRAKDSLENEEFVAVHLLVLLIRGVLCNFSMRARRSQVLGLPCALQTHCAQHFSHVL